MNVAVTIYALDPEKGSESGMGWRFMLELSKFNAKVTVYTRKNNVNKARLYLSNMSVNNIDLVGVDINRRYLFWKRGLLVFCFIISFGSCWFFAKLEKKILK